jgi:hypothetical protein
MESEGKKTEALSGNFGAVPCSERSAGFSSSRLTIERRHRQECIKFRPSFPRRPNRLPLIRYINFRTRATRVALQIFFFVFSFAKILFLHGFITRFFLGGSTATVRLCDREHC